jgi:signal transduction histidine kinase
MPAPAGTVPLQPNLYGVMGIFAIVRVVFAVLFVVMATVATNSLTLFAWVPLIASTLVLAFVMSKTLQIRMGERHMWIAIALATADVLLVTSLYTRWSANTWFLPIGNRPELPPFFGNVTAIAVFFNEGTPPISPLFTLLSLFVLTIVICWRYDLRITLGFIALTTVIDTALIVWTSTNIEQVVFNLAMTMLRVPVFAILALVITYLLRIQNQQHRSLLAANAKLVRHMAVVEELTISHERNRLARELHDTLAHTLSAASVQLEAANSLWTRDRDTAHMALTQALKITRSGLAETRRALEALRASPLEDLGLVLALRELGDLTRQRSGAQVTVTMPAQFEPLPSEIEQTLYRAAQEALENIVRHARASHVTLTLKQHGPAVAMTIKDDGVGFDVAAAQNRPGHFGLNGMAERIEALGGRVAILSRPGEGTSISLELMTYDDSRVAVR